MDPVGALWHLANFLAPALGLGLIASACAKLLWRNELRGASLLRLWAWTAGAAWLASVVGLIVFAHDGQMATYVAMVAASAGVLWAISLRAGRA